MNSVDRFNHFDLKVQIYVLTKKRNNRNKNSFCFILNCIIQLKASSSMPWPPKLKKIEQILKKNI